MCISIFVAYKHSTENDNMININNIIIKISQCFLGGAWVLRACIHLALWLMWSIVNPAVSDIAVSFQS